MENPNADANPTTDAPTTTTAPLDGAANVSQVLILYTGGTIGMKETPRGFAPVPGFLAEQMAKLPQFHDPTQPVFTTPPSRFGRRIRFDIREFSTLLDSSNMDMDDWARMAADIRDHYDAYDAFVILHGTDTMAYSASALSFMFDNLAKTVILTGSQIPLMDVRNDAVENLLGALMIAGHYEIPEVCVYFHNKLFRGNRTQKTDAQGFDAFDSGNYPRLVDAGIDMVVNWDKILPTPDGPFSVQTAMCPHVAALRIFPGITAAIMRNFLQPPIRGLVLETFGAGNAPDDRQDFLDVLREATNRGVVIVNCTQCRRGAVGTEYAAGRALAEAGVISGADLTPEAALTKLSYLLERDLPLETVKRLMQKNLRGEMTQPEPPRFNFRDKTFARSVEKLLDRAGSGRTVEPPMMERALFPVLLCSAGALGDVGQLKRMIALGADVNVGDYDGRTALHLAAAEGHTAAVQFLLAHTAKVNVRDRWGNTPLADAERYSHSEIAQILRAAGR